MTDAKEPVRCLLCNTAYVSWPGECRCGSKSYASATSGERPGLSMMEVLRLQKALLPSIPHGHTIAPEIVPSVIAANGIIEECLEYLNALGYKSWRPDPLPEDKQLEEIADMLFFFAELILFSKFSWERISAAYLEKYKVNLDRWERLKRGDTSWDNRGKKEGL